MRGYSLRSLNALTFLSLNAPSLGLIIFPPPKKKKEKKREKRKKRKKKKGSPINNAELKEVGN